jgi:hypothetical protein
MAPPAKLHSIYIILEIVKLLVLAIMTFDTARQLVRLPTNSSS